MTRATSIRQASLTPDSVVIFRIELKLEEGSPNTNWLLLKAAIMLMLFLCCISLAGYFVVPSLIESARPPPTHSGSRNPENFGLPTLRQQVEKGWRTKKESQPEPKEKKTPNTIAMQDNFLRVLQETLGVDAESRIALDKAIDEALDLLRDS